MSNISVIFGWLIAAIYSMGLGAVQGAEKGPSIEEVKKIVQAAPSEPRVKPEKARKVLVFSMSWGFKHSSIPYGKEAFELIGKKSGAYKPVVSDDISMFEPENLKQFDAVVFNNTNNEIFLPENYDKLGPEEKKKADETDARLKKSLVDYLKGGGGLAVIHAGVASFRKWPEYGNIIGARFDNHPWNAGSTITMKVEEPGHPVAAAFKEPTFEITDEIYQLTVPYTRDKIRVLVSIDTDKTNMDIKGIHRTDNDFAMSYIKSYGEGRVFYCAFGHQHELFWNPVILEHFLDGVQFATGDLEGDMRPSNKIKK